ncbi:MAG: DNA-methyltransferase, partial [Candidatus Hodarchaeales archaeon]
MIKGIDSKKNVVSNSFDDVAGQIIYYKSSEDMLEVKDESIDLIITSPPYNRKKHYSDDHEEQYNDNLSDEDYFALLKRVWKECYRVLKPSGLFFLNIGDAAQDQGKSHSVVDTAVDVGFIRLQTIIWVKSLLGKGHYTPSGGNRRLNNIWENIFVLVKDKKQYKIYPKEIGIPFADKSNIGRYSDQDLRDAGNIWFIPYTKTTGATIKKGHDAPFPIELPYKCMKLTKAQSVLDPFGGTCSTLA